MHPSPAFPAGGSSSCGGRGGSGGGVPASIPFASLWSVIRAVQGVRAPRLRQARAGRRGPMRGGAASASCLAWDASASTNTGVCLVHCSDGEHVEMVLLPTGADDGWWCPGGSEKKEWEEEKEDHHPHHHPAAWAMRASPFHDGSEDSERPCLSPWPFPTAVGGAAATVLSGAALPGKDFNGACALWEIPSSLRFPSCASTLAVSFFSPPVSVSGSASCAPSLSSCAVASNEAIEEKARDFPVEYAPQEASEDKEEEEEDEEAKMHALDRWAPPFFAGCEDGSLFVYRLFPSFSSSRPSGEGVQEAKEEKEEKVAPPPPHHSCPTFPSPSLLFSPSLSATSLRGPHTSNIHSVCALPPYWKEYGHPPVTPPLSSASSVTGETGVPPERHTHRRPRAPPAVHAARHVGTLVRRSVEVWHRVISVGGSATITIWQQTSPTRLHRTTTTTGGANERKADTDEMPSMGQWTVLAVVSPLQDTREASASSLARGSSWTRRDPPTPKKKKKKKMQKMEGSTGVANDSSASTVPSPPPHSPSAEVPRYLAVAPLRSLFSPPSNEDEESTPFAPRLWSGASFTALSRDDWFIVGSSDGTVHCYRLEEGVWCHTPCPIENPSSPRPSGASPREYGERTWAVVHREGQLPLAPSARRPVWCVAPLDAVVMQTSIPHRTVLSATAAAPPPPPPAKATVEVGDTRTKDTHPILPPHCPTPEVTHLWCPASPAGVIHDRPTRGTDGGASPPFSSSSSSVAASTGTARRCCTPRFVAGDGGGHVFLVQCTLSVRCVDRDHPGTPPPPSSARTRTPSTSCQQMVEDTARPTTRMQVISAVHLESCAVNALTTNLYCRDASGASIASRSLWSPYYPRSPPPHGNEADVALESHLWAESDAPRMIVAITDSGTVHLLVVQEASVVAFSNDLPALPVSQAKNDVDEANAYDRKEWEETTSPSAVRRRMEARGERETLLMPVMRIAIGMTAGRGISWGNMHFGVPFHLHRDGRNRRDQEEEEREDIIAVCEERVVRLRLCYPPLASKEHSHNRGESGCSGVRGTAFLPPGSFLRIVKEHRCNVRGVSGMMVMPWTPHRTQRRDAQGAEEEEGRRGTPQWRERMQYRVVLVGQGMEVFQC